MFPLKSWSYKPPKNAWSEGLTFERAPDALSPNSTETRIRDRGVQGGMVGRAHKQFVIAMGIQTTGADSICIIIRIEDESKKELERDSSPAAKFPSSCSIKTQDIRVIGPKES